MVVDGKALSKEVITAVRATLSQLTGEPVLVVLVVGDDPVTTRFVRMKSLVAHEAGVQMEVKNFPSTAKEEDLIDAISASASRVDVTGIIVQLPLPLHIDADRVLSAIPVEKDVDVLNKNAIANVRMGTSPILPPVAAAVQYILERSGVSVAGKEVLVVGNGKLVGAPVALLMRHNDAHVTVIDRPISDLRRETLESEVIIAGTGNPSLITPDMVQDGAVLVDAGTSEQGGKIVGDIDPACAQKASLFTPTPGGVGPLTVAMLFKNCAILYSRHVGT